MYADGMTDSMRAAIEETDRRRSIQERFNREHGIEPTTIVKEIRDLNDRLRVAAETSAPYGTAGERGFDARSREEVERLVARMETDMRAAAKALEFERAAALRDEVRAIRLRVLEEDASLAVGRSAEAAGRVDAPERAPRGRGGRPGHVPEDAPVLEVTRVTVVPAGEEPAGIDEGTAADWLPGLRDEHEDESGWQARWLDRPTWDHAVTPNIRRRTGRRPGRRG
jgi:hypothetical protein